MLLIKIIYLKDNLCHSYYSNCLWLLNVVYTVHLLILGITDYSRVKVVGIYSGSLVLKTIIEPTLVDIDLTDLTENETTNGTQVNNASNGTANVSETNMTELDQVLSKKIQDGVLTSVLESNLGVTVLKMEH